MPSQTSDFRRACLGWITIRWSQAVITEHHLLVAGDKAGRYHNARRTADVLAIQRDRLLDAFANEVGLRGLAATNIADVCRRAGLSLTTFVEVFRSKSGCAVEMFLICSEMVRESGEAAFNQTGGPWERRLHAAVGGDADLLSTSPGFARLAVDMRHDVR
jgi:AcrR family transcriptional regulator